MLYIYNKVKICIIFIAGMAFQQVTVFSDSQLYPVVEKEALVHRSWYVNGTPGGMVLDTSVELESAVAARCM